MSTQWKTLASALSFALFGLALLWTYAELDEAFGWDGPYQGRTVNMDKWQNPIPVLAVVDALVLLIVVLLMRKVIQAREDRRSLPAGGGDTTEATRARSKDVRTKTPTRR